MQRVNGCPGCGKDRCVRIAPGMVYCFRMQRAFREGLSVQKGVKTTGGALLGSGRLSRKPSQVQKTFDWVARRYGDE